MYVTNFNFTGWQNGTVWFNRAITLKEAADMVREAYLKGYNHVDRLVKDSVRSREVLHVTAGRDFRDIDKYSVFMMLMGYSMENLFRGIIICGEWLEDPDSIDAIVNYNEFKAHTKGSEEANLSLMSHGLRRLLGARHMNITFTDEEKSMMDDLDGFITWKGRYPVPKEYSSDDPKGLKDFIEVLQPINPSYPYQVIDYLYVKSMEELANLCKNQGEKLG